MIWIFPEGKTKKGEKCDPVCLHVGLECRDFSPWVILFDIQ